MLIPVVDKALKEAKVTLNEIDLIAVAYGPGLVGALLIGINSAKALALALGKPFIGVNHIEAHLYAVIMSHPQQINFPVLGVVLSGGHTALVLVHDIGSYELIGQTADDAIGEAFDKAAKILELPYPGGPEIEALAQRGNPECFSFKAGQVKGKPFDFSFSGLKTAVLYAAKGQNGQLGHTQLNETDKCDIAAAFQQAALLDIVNKTNKAVEKYGCRTIILGGGVTNNQRLRQMFSEALPNHQILWPSRGLSLDNAAMIAGLGYPLYQRKQCSDSLGLEAATSLPF